MDKIQTAKLCIKHAESLYSEDLCTSNIETILTLPLSDQEKQKQINSFGERIAQACEYYLKGLTIPYMTFADYTPMTEAENDVIVNDRQLGIRKYGHSLKNLLTANNELPSTIKAQILLSLSRNLKDHTVISARHNADKKYFQSIFPDASEKTIEMLSRTNPDIIEHIDQKEDFNSTIDTLINIIDNLTNQNQNAYIKARYGAIEGYEADVKFLWEFVKSVRTAIPLAYPNAISVKSANKYIFPDEQTLIATVTNENEEYYEFDGSKFLYYQKDGAKSLHLKQEIDGQTIIYEEDGKKTILTKLPDINYYIECDYNQTLIPDKQKTKRK